MDVRSLLVLSFLACSFPVVLAACGGGGDAGGGGGDGGGDAEADGQAGGSAGAGSSGVGDGDPVGEAPAIEGFAFQLETGDFWEFGWTTQSSSYAQGSGGGASETTGVFRLTLGEAVEIDGIQAFALAHAGDGFAPRWKFLALDDHRLLVAEEDRELVVLFDARTGTWPGSGLFGTFDASTLYEARTGTLSNPHYEGSALVVSASSESGQCEYFSDVGTICGSDSQESYDEREYYAPGIGPVGYYYRASFDSCGGGFCSGSSTEHQVGLIASSRRGDAAGRELESEPNDGPSQAQAISNEVEGRAETTDAAPEGTEVSVLRVEAELEPNDDPNAAQLLAVPASMSGRVDDGDTAHAVFFPYDGSAYMQTMHDWYAITIEEPTLVSLVLDTEQASATRQLGIVLFDASTTAVRAGDPTRVEAAEPLAFDFTTDASKSIEGELPAGDYLVAVEGVAVPAGGGVEYELTFTTMREPATRVIEDWFALSVASGGADLLLEHTGNQANDVDLYVFDAATRVLVAASAGPPILDERVDALPAGEYLIGVDLQVSPGATGGADTYRLQVLSQGP